MQRLLFEGNCAAHIRDQLEAMLVNGRILQVMYNTGNAPPNKQQFIVDFDEISLDQPCLLIPMDTTYLIKFQA